MATYTPLQSIAISSSTLSVTFSNIPQDYTDLVVVAKAKSAPGGGHLSAVNMNLQFNGDNASSYSNNVISSGGGINGAVTYAGSTRDIALYTAYMGGGIGETSSVRANIMNYSNSTTFKTVLSHYSNATSDVNITAGAWRSTAPITSVTVSGANRNYAAGATFDLYGIKSGAPKMMGGDVVVTDGNYWYHAFKTSGSISSLVQYPISADILAVGGGSSSGQSAAGGGGAGAVVYAAATSVSAGTYTVTVGAGGPVYTVGVNTTFGSLVTAAGGGLGGGEDTAAPSNTSGGSGGGGGGSASAATKAGSAAGSGSSGGTVYAFAGGIGNQNYNGGGGGGAGAVGGSATTTTPGSGGAGINTYSSWLSLFTGIGVSGYIAGGGGGCTFNGTPSSGGAGGGGAGGRYTPAQAQTAGTANTGGGGGGGNGVGNGAAGGSGFVIVRYAV